MQTKSDAMNFNEGDLARAPLGGNSGWGRRKAIAPPDAKNHRRRSAEAVLRRDGRRKHSCSRLNAGFQAGAAAADLAAIDETHEAFYGDQVAGIPPSRMLVQPCNRGTAPAIVYSLLYLREMDPDGVVAFFPSDHYFSDDDAFARHMESAYAAAASPPGADVLWVFHPTLPRWSMGGSSLGSPVMCAEFRFSCESFLGETAPETRRDSDGARLSLEQLRYGRPCQRFPEPNPTHASVVAWCI